MAQNKQDPKGDELTVGWLRDQLVKLLEHASDLASPDHPACAKYADLLFKMLPRSGKEERAGNDEVIERAREAIRESRRPSSDDPSPP